MEKAQRDGEEGRAVSAEMWRTRNVLEDMTDIGLDALHIWNSHSFLSVCLPSAPGPLKSCSSKVQSRSLYLWKPLYRSQRDSSIYSWRIQLVFTRHTNDNNQKTQIFMLKYVVLNLFMCKGKKTFHRSHHVLVACQRSNLRLCLEDICLLCLTVGAQPVSWHKSLSQRWTSSSLSLSVIDDAGTLMKRTHTFFNLWSALL